MNPNAYKGESYNPTSPHDSIGNENQGSSKLKGNSSDGNNDGTGKSPTISQIMRDFDLK